MKAGAIHAVIGTAVLGAVVLAPPAEAAGTGAQVVAASCTAGPFRGTVSVTYQPVGTTEYHPGVATIGGGPYIGDSATFTLDVSYAGAGTTTSVYTGTFTGTAGTKLSVHLPDDVKVPQDVPSYASVAFDGGASPCTARAEIR
ncbi:hypothetical protein MUY14_29690 [Amycolatopsis sp. FBCC-B4732]|uniref:hypothetical protein n=1 Tax=unclassified Amycolatopsis TaxID=2618356 RepID=UPI001FF6F776|nr:hypothetical protein [Amycolatopsis sp. FBCC-B4732]UOX85934.1 hypothetical protein MUY14_29690 [Amycolatopsis sp. FBCC-B4732]